MRVCRHRIFAAPEVAKRGSKMNRRARAVTARTVGNAVAVEEIDVEPPRHGEVTIRLAACGVCHSDLSATNGTIGYPLPLILGHEGAGVVADVGEGVRQLKPGDPVITPDRK